MVRRNMSKENRQKTIHEITKQLMGECLPCTPADKNKPVLLSFYNLYFEVSYKDTQKNSTEKIINEKLDEYDDLELSKLYFEYCC